MPKLPLVAVFLLASPLVAQQSGVSHPPDAAVEDAAPAQLPATVPVVNAPVLVVPVDRGASTALQAAPSDEIQTDSPAITLQRRDLAKFDPDSRVVGDDLVNTPYAIAAGTLVRARLETSIHTATTQPGTPFRAQVTEPVMHEGRVIVPAGAVLEGHVTEVRGGRRLHGPALIHLQAQTIVLPDGSRMPLHASVIDTDKFADTRIDEEGNIVRKDHSKQALSTLALTTGSAAAAGGLIAGVPGALVGAGVGAGLSTVMWLKADRQTELPPDTVLVLALDSPLPVQPLIHEPNFSEEPVARPNTAPASATPTAPEPQAFVPVS